MGSMPPDPPMCCLHTHITLAAPPTVANQSLFLYYFITMVTNLFLYYSMENSNRGFHRQTFFRTCTVILFVISAVCCAITIGVGWALQTMAPGNDLILAAAILTTVPIIFVTVFIPFACIYRKTCSFDAVHMYILRECMKCPVFTIGTLAGLTETTGAVLFVVAGVNNPDVLAFGVSAGVFGIISGLTCICTQFCWCVYTYNPHCI